MLRVTCLTFGLVMSLHAYAAAAEDDPKSRLPSMTVTAAATRDVVPDIAVLHLSISVESPKSSTAAEDVARSSQAVIAEMKAQGLDPADIKTAFNVSPVFDEERDPDGRNLKRTLRGYLARNAVTVRLRDTARAGALARTLIDKGANVFEGIDFVVGDDRLVMDELRVQATKDALHRAKLYAEAAGVRLGRVLTIDPDPDANGVADMPRRGPPMNGTVTKVIPVEPGTERLQAKVSVTWEISP